MTWEEELLALWDDLEQQAEGLALRQRDAEVAELARSEYAEVDLAGRLVGSLGGSVELTVSGVGVLRGRLAGSGSGWCLLAEREPAPHGTEWVVPTSRLLAVRGLTGRASLEGVRPLTTRLGLGSVLRRLGERAASVVLVLADGQRRSGSLGRVGADFVELRSEGGLPDVVPFNAVAALRSR